MQQTVSNIKENKIGFYSGNRARPARVAEDWRTKSNIKVRKLEHADFTHIIMLWEVGEDKKTYATTNWHPIIRLSSNEVHKQFAVSVFCIVSMCMD